MHTVTVFRPHSLQVGQKIRIEDETHGEDWEVIGLSGRKVRLRCPVSGQEIERAGFYQFAEKRQVAQWPSED